MRFGRERIIAELEAKGQKFHTFVIDVHSDHAVDDWEWNQHDHLHVPFIHGLWDHATGVIEDDYVAGVVLQRVFGLSVPVVRMHYHNSPTERVFLTVLGPLVMVNEVDIKPEGSGTFQRMTYSIGGSPMMYPLTRAAEWFVRRNYAHLLTEDEPLIKRRTELRRRGFSFRSGLEARSWVRSLVTTVDHVIPPAPTPHPPHVVNVRRSPGEWLVGTDDHLGLRIVRHESRIDVYPRICLHQGASLDGCPVSQQGIRCPWHGRTNRALATFDLAEGQRVVKQTTWHRLTLEADELRIEVRPAEPAATDESLERAAS